MDSGDGDSRATDASKVAHKLSSTQHAIAGASAGVTARFFVAPLDVVKIRLQSQSEPITLGGSIGGSPKYRGIASTARTIVAEEGFRALWKGNWPAEMLYLTYGGAQFFFYDEALEILAGDTPISRRLKLCPGAANFLAGSFAGATATVATYPLDLLRTRFALQGNTIVYRSMAQAIRSIYRTENGPRGFYKGLGPALLQIVPYMGIMFQAYHGTRDAMNFWLTGIVHSEFKPGKGNAWVDFFAGGFAGLISKLAVMPFDTVRKRLQCQFPLRSELAVSNIPNYMGGFLSTVSQIIKQEGFLGLYKGTVPGLLKALPNSAITFATYEFVKRFLVDRRSDYTTAP